VHLNLAAVGWTRSDSNRIRTRSESNSNNRGRKNEVRTVQNVGLAIIQSGQLVVFAVHVGRQTGRGQNRVGRTDGAGNGGDGVGDV
jgi:hypothetical protein